MVEKSGVERSRVEKSGGWDVLQPNVQLVLQVYYVKLNCNKDVYLLITLWWHLKQNKTGNHFFLLLSIVEIYICPTVCHGWKRRKKNQDPFSCSLSCSGFEACVYCNLAMCMYVVPKGQLISEGNFSVFKFPKKQTFFWRISALWG